MHILLTNDDGIWAPGIAGAYTALREMGDVSVVAPDDVKSGTGHGITLKSPLLTSRVKVGELFEGFSVDGSPADCVKLAVNQLLTKPADLVVSGINSGVNVGINVIYSGTVAAALEAGFLGLPAVALSLCMKKGVNPDYALAAKVSLDVIRKLLEGGLTKGQVVSVNIPTLENGIRPKGVKVCRQSVKPWVDTYEKRVDPRGENYFWNQSVFSLSTDETDTDMAYIRDGYVTVTPLMFDLTDHRGLDQLRKMKLD